MSSYFYTFALFLCTQEFKTTFVTNMHIYVCVCMCIYIHTHTHIFSASFMKENTYPNFS